MQKFFDRKARSSFTALVLMSLLDALCPWTARNLAVAAEDDFVRVYIVLRPSQHTALMAPEILRQFGLEPMNRARFSIEVRLLHPQEQYGHAGIIFPADEAGVDLSQGYRLMGVEPWVDADTDVAQLDADILDRIPIRATMTSPIAWYNRGINGPYRNELPTFVIPVEGTTGDWQIFRRNLSILRNAIERSVDTTRWSSAQDHNDFFFFRIPMSRFDPTATEGPCGNCVGAVERLFQGTNFSVSPDLPNAAQLLVSSSSSVQILLSSVLQNARLGSCFSQFNLK